MEEGLHSKLLDGWMLNKWNKKSIAVFWDEISEVVCWRIGIEMAVNGV